MFPWYSVILAHVRDNLRYSICLRHFIRSRKVTKSDFFSRKGLFSLLRFQHILSYHILQVPWMFMYFTKETQKCYNWAVIFISNPLCCPLSLEYNVHSWMFYGVYLHPARHQDYVDHENISQTCCREAAKMIFLVARPLRRGGGVNAGPLKVFLKLEKKS